MSTSHGSSTDIIGNGYVLSEFLHTAGFSGSREASESTTFKKKSKTYVPGLKDHTMACEGVYDGDVDAVDDILWAALESDMGGVFSYIPDGQEIVGHRVFSLAAIESSYEINTEVGDVAQITAEMSAGDKGRFLKGKVAHPMAVENAGGNSAAINGGAQTERGASLVVHTTASAALDVKLQDSADGVTFADLPGSLTFNVGRGSQQLLVPGTIRRHTRVLWTGTGTFLAVIGRNI